MDRELLTRLEEAFARAQTALADEAWDGALAASDELAQLRHASAYEVRARAQWGAGRREEALRTLTEGLLSAPHVWRLWEVFGVFHSELGNLEEADSAFRNALRCPEADQASVAYHCALNRVRQERVLEALDMLEALAELGSDLGLRLPLLRARLLALLERWDEAIAAADEALAGCDPDAERALQAALVLERGKAHWHGRADKDRALVDARRARTIAGAPLADAWLGDLENEP